jgi:hypothetical protein
MEQNLDQQLPQQPITQPLPEQPVQPPLSPKRNSVSSVLFILLGVIVLICITGGVYYFWQKNQLSLNSSALHLTSAKTVLPTVVSDATFVSQNMTGWQTYNDSSYSFKYPFVWTVLATLDPITHKEIIQILLPLHADIQAYIGPNPDGNPGGGGGPEVPTFINNKIIFAYHGKQQMLAENITLLGSEKTFAKVVLDQIQLDSAKNIDASFISYKPSMSLREYYSLRNTFLTLLQTVVVK